jgi:ABC-2 type transport system permease protein
MFIATFTHKTKKMLGISLGIVFASYIIQIFSQLADSIEFLRFFSLFTLSDIRNVILHNSISFINIIFSVCLSVMFLLLTVYRYDNKELL